MGFKQFCAFLGVAKITTSGMSLTELLAVMCVFAAYLFFFRGLQPATIRNYVQGTDHHLRMLNIIPGSVYHPALNQTLRGIDRQTSFETALINRAKLPFSLPLILLARLKLLHGATVFELHAIFTALCFGFMFLLRKSEYLPNKAGKGKKVNGINYTLLSDNVYLWWDGTPYLSTASFLPSTPPDYISIFLDRSKGDPLGKGATRFFPRQPGANFCLVTVVYRYVREAKLRPGDYFFGGPRFTVYDSLVANTMKKTAAAAGLDAARVALHSLRVGGLVSLFAAGAPAHLMVLAGRWASESSFVQYMRATMEQYNTIAAALNRVDLVTAQHIKCLYSAP